MKKDNQIKKHLLNNNLQMKCLFFSIGLLICLTLLNSLTAQPNLENSPKEENDNFHIKVIYPGHSGEQIILGHYYDYMVMGDIETQLDNQSSCEFKGSTPLKGGIYTFIVNGKVVPGDFVVDKDQNFIVYLNDEVTNGSIFQDFEGSVENDQLLEYQAFMAKQGEEIHQYHQLISQASNPEESARYFDVLNDIDDRIRAYRNQFIQKAPKSTLGVTLTAITDPKLPEHLRNPQNREDSLAAKVYMSKHFWDGTKFWDGRIANTPFMSDKLDRYFGEVLISHKDTVIREIDKMLANAVVDSMLYRLILGKAIKGSKDHFFKWDDAVFIHLYEKYFAPEPISWLTEQERDEIDKHAFFLMGHTSGAKAPEITLSGLENEPVSLYDQEAKYTIVAFWDPTCDHCKVTLPKLDSLYQNHWKKQGLKIFSVGVESDATETEWRSIINQNQLTDWNHVYNSRSSMMETAKAGKKLVTKSYDVWYFPTFFLLDKDKKFMARKLSFEKMSELVNSILAE